MKNAIELHTKKKIDEQIQITGGYSFETWLIILEDGSKVIFRTGKDAVIEGGRQFIVSDIFEREAHFYETINKAYNHRCPEILIIDDTLSLYSQPYQIMSYLPGVPLNHYLPQVNDEIMHRIYYGIGKLAAETNGLEISSAHSLYQSEPWEIRFQRKFAERLTPIVKSQVVSKSEERLLLSQLNTLKANKTNALLHLDIRLPNLIYHDDVIHLIDAENCDVGDPLYELAVISVAGILNNHFLRGYKAVCDYDLHLDSPLFKFYRFERLAALVNLFLNILRNDQLAKPVTDSLNRLKDEILYSGCESIS